MKHRAMPQKKHMLSTASVAGTCLAIVLLAACSPSTEPGQTGGGSNTGLPENVVIGEYGTITEPDMLSDGTSGTAFHKGGDEELQQDRITGGANTGGVASENLDPLEEGLIDPKIHANPVPGLPKGGNPRTIPHELEGRGDCASCHAAPSSERPLPQDHVDADIGSDLCQVCHKK